MQDFLFGPVPHSEAADFIADKPVVSKEVFEGLLPELRSRAFMISGVQAADAVQAIRDRIAQLPQGANWNDVKKDVAAKISAHFVDPAAGDEDQAKQVSASNARAELLLRTQGFMAYQTAACVVQERQKDVLPFYQYLTMGDSRVRHTHAVLNGIVLPADSPFWDSHTGPWDYNCRCQRVQLSPEDVDDLKQQDADKPADAQRVLEGPVREQLEQHDRLVRGPNKITDVARPTGPGAFSWRPGQESYTVADLERRYDAKTFAQFKAWAQKAEVDSGKTVWQWLTKEPGSSTLPAEPAQPAPAAKTPAQPVKPVAAKEPSKSVTELLASIGAPAAAPATAEHMVALVDGLRKLSPAKAADSIASLSLASGFKNITAAGVQRLLQDYLNLVSPEIVAQLPKLNLEVRHSISGLGDYNEASRVLRLNGGLLDADAKALRRTLYHELTHWLHDHSPAANIARIEALFSRRTGGFKEPIVRLKPFDRASVTGYEDDLVNANGDSYAGRVYPFEDRKKPRGYEVATRHLEMLALSPDELLRHWNLKSPKTGDYAWREAFIEALHLLYPPTPP